MTDHTTVRNAGVAQASKQALPASGPPGLQAGQCGAGDRGKALAKGKRKRLGPTTKDQAGKQRRSAKKVNREMESFLDELGKRMKDAEESGVEQEEEPEVEDQDEQDSSNGGAGLSHTVPVPGALGASSNEKTPKKDGCTAVYEKTKFLKKLPVISYKEILNFDGDVQNKLYDALLVAWNNCMVDEVAAYQKQQDFKKLNSEVQQTEQEKSDLVKTLESIQKEAAGIEEEEKKLAERKKVIAEKTQVLASDIQKISTRLEQKNNEVQDYQRQKVIAAIEERRRRIKHYVQTKK